MSKKPSPRSIWKGHVSVGLVTIPVRVYNAVDTSEKISFNEIHKDCNGRIGRTSPCKKCGKVHVERADVLKGYQYGPDEYVTFTDDELKAVQLKSTKVVEVQGFVPLAEIDSMLVESPYFIGPDGEVAHSTYALIASALAKRKVAAVGKMVLRNREDAVAIVAKDGGLMLLKLRQPGEVRQMADTPGMPSKSEKPSKPNMALAEQLIDSMTSSMDDLDLTDQYRAALKDLVEAKVNKREITLVESGEARTTVPGDIMDVLRASIDAVGSKKSKKAKKAA